MWLKKDIYEDFDDQAEKLSDLIDDPALNRRAPNLYFDTATPKDSDLNKNKEIKI